MKKYYILFALFLILLVVSIVSMTTSAGPPVVTVTPASHRIVAKSGEKVRATYRIHNRGGDVLLLGSATTSCGCSIASVSTRSIPPEDSGTITVEGIPPDAGEKVVRVEIEANTVDRIIRLELILVGNKQPPFVVTSYFPHISFAISLNFGGSASSEVIGVRHAQ